jgi:hypothetical protein
VAAGRAVEITRAPLIIDNTVFNQSLRVPSHWMRRIGKALQWVTPLVLTALLGWLVAARDWVKERVSATYLVTGAVADAKAAMSYAHTASSRSAVHEAELVLVWRELVLVHAELEVLRTYSKAADRGELIEQARKFYGHAYTVERDSRPNEPPSASAARVLGLTWRPDR